MELCSFQYVAGRWSFPSFPSLDSPRTLLLAFGAPSFGRDPRPLQQLSEAFPKSVLLGCSTAGEIFGSEIFDESISVALLRFEHSRLRQASAQVQGAADSFSAGASLARSLRDPELRAVLVLSDGTRVNGSHLVAGLSSELPPQVIVTGGLAGDGTTFGQTWVWTGGEPEPGRVAAVGLYGDRLQVAYGSKGGWDFFGPERVVTRSEDHVLYELDGRPALDLYKEYLGDRAAELPASALIYPLSIRADRNASERVVRTILSVSEQNRSMTFAGNIPTGHLAQLMRANFDRLVDGAAGASQSLSRMLSAGPLLCIAISCVGRRIVLGERTEEEVEAVLEGLDPRTLQVGFYSYGEISPCSSGRCDLHNQTMTLTALGES